MNDVLIVYSLIHVNNIIILSLSLSLSPHTDTSVSDIEEAFKSFTTRSDISVLLINQYVCTPNLVIDWYNFSTLSLATELSS